MTYRQSSTCPAELLRLLLAALFVVASACGPGEIDGPGSTPPAADPPGTVDPTTPDPTTPGPITPEPTTPEPTTPEPTFPPAPASGYAGGGPFKVVSNGQAGPGGAFSLYLPDPLGKGGVKHPIITWGNGTGAPTFVYGPLLTHLASHGFVVIATNSTQTGSGKEMVQGVDWLIAENARAGSALHDQLVIDAICATGHSQGGGGSINAGNDPRIKCTAPIQPSPGNTAGLSGAMFLIAGAKDTIVSESLVTTMVFNPAKVATVYGIKVDADHFAPIGAADDSIRGYLTAWFRAQLMNDTKARDLFFGQSCGICGDPKWQVQRKNL